MLHTRSGPRGCGVDAHQHVAQRLIQTDVAGQRVAHADANARTLFLTRNVLEKEHHCRGYATPTMAGQDCHAADVDRLGFERVARRADRLRVIVGQHGTATTYHRQNVVDCFGVRARVNRQRALVFGECCLHDAPHQRRFVEDGESNANGHPAPSGLDAVREDLAEQLVRDVEDAPPLLNASGLCPRLDRHDGPGGAGREPQQ